MDQIPILKQENIYRTVINYCNAIAADSIVKDKFAKHKEGIQLLSQSEVSSKGSAYWWLRTISRKVVSFEF